MEYTLIELLILECDLFISGTTYSIFFFSFKYGKIILWFNKNKIYIDF